MLKNLMILILKTTSYESDDTEGSSSDSVYPDRFVPPPRKSKYYSKHKKREKKMHRKHTRSFDEEDSDYLPFKSHKQHITKQHKGQDDEMDDLIRRMQSININDSLYATLYYKAYKVDPEIAQIVPRPGFDHY